MRRPTLVQTLWVACIVSGLTPPPATAQDCNDLYNPNQVLELRVEMDPSDWQTLRNSCPDGLCKPPPHSYFPAFLECDGIGPIFVGIRRKNGPADPSEGDPQKVALKIDINEFVPNQTFAGRSKLSLENGSDGALVTEGMAWQVYQAAGLVVCRSAWVNVYVNGDYKGLYSNVEQVDKTFLTEHGLDNGGFLFKVHEQRTREAEANPFGFNWYPFDHPTNDPPEEPAPPDWREQATTRVNMPHLLAFAAAENFIANTDGVVIKMVNYWYYDWSILPGDDPAGQQPRLYLPWDLDTTMKNQQFDLPILDSGTGHLQQGLIEELEEGGDPYDEPTFQADYLAAYTQLLSGPLALPQVLTIINDIEPIIAAHMDADPYQQTGDAAGEFQRIRDYFQARTEFVLNELPPGLPADYDLDGDVDFHDWSALMICYTGDNPAECATVRCRGVFDSDGDCDVDAADVEVFLSLVTGP